MQAAAGRVVVARQQDEALEVIEARGRAPGRAADPDGPRLRRLRASAAAWWSRARTACSTCRRPACSARTSSPTPAWPSPRPWRSAIRASTRRRSPGASPARPGPARFQQLDHGPLRRAGEGGRRRPLARRRRTIPMPAAGAGRRPGRASAATAARSCWSTACSAARTPRGFFEAFRDLTPQVFTTGFEAEARRRPKTWPRRRARRAWTPSHARTSTRRWRGRWRRRPERPRRDLRLAPFRRRGAGPVAGDLAES